MVLSFRVIEVFTLKNQFLGGQRVTKALEVSGSIRNFWICFIFHAIYFMGSGSVSFSRGSISMMDPRQILHNGMVDLETQLQKHGAVL